MLGQSVCGCGSEFMAVAADEISYFVGQYWSIDGSVARERVGVGKVGITLPQ